MGVRALVQVISNIDVYWAIAEQAHADMQALLSAHRTPKPNGELGFIMRIDPERRSFKQAMIAIVFSGMVLEAFLYLLLLKHLGKAQAAKVDHKPLEERVKALGITDAGLLSRVVAFREARKELVHEKAIDISEIGGQTMRTAQREAELAIALVKELRTALAAP
jgi:hypothetical protein